MELGVSESVRIIMIVHLLVAGIRSPLDEWCRTYAWWPVAPGLEAILSHSHGEGLLGDSLYSVSACLLGLSAPQTLANYRLLGQGYDLADEVWFCADPVHLRADVNAALLIEGACLGLDIKMAHRLQEGLNDFFGSEGWSFRVTSPTTWYARPPERFSLPKFENLSALAGQDIGIVLRQTRTDKNWKRFYAELQMWLVQVSTPLLSGQEKLSPVNSLWFWGGTPLQGGAGFDMGVVCAKDPAICGMGLKSGIPVEEISVQELLEQGRNAMVWLDSLHFGSAYDDLDAWESALAILDENWFRPLAEALHTGKVSEVHLYDQRFHWVSHRTSRWRFWEGQKTLSAALGLSPK